MPEKRRGQSDKLALAEKRTNELMEKYHNCAQCTLVAVLEASNLQEEGLSKASSGLAGGIGGTQSVCGALTGAALALGLKYGRDTRYLSGPADEAVRQQEEGIQQVARLAKWFEREFGSTICDELRRAHMGTGLSMGIAWQNKWADQLGMRKRCQEIAARTARRATAMLDNPNLDILETA